MLRDYAISFLKILRKLPLTTRKNTRLLACEDHKASVFSIFPLAVLCSTLATRVSHRPFCVSQFRQQFTQDAVTSATESRFFNSSSQDSKLLVLTGLFLLKLLSLECRRPPLGCVLMMFCLHVHVLGISKFKSLRPGLILMAVL